MLQSTFNMQQFLERCFLPLSLYCLGMLTFEDEYALQFPNLTVKTIFTEYFNEVEKIEVSLGYTDMWCTPLDLSSIGFLISIDLSARQSHRMCLLH